MIISIILYIRNTSYLKWNPVERLKYRRSSTTSVGTIEKVKSTYLTYSLCITFLLSNYMYDLSACMSYICISIISYIRNTSYLKQNSFDRLKYLSSCTQALLVLKNDWYMAQKYVTYYYNKHHIVYIQVHMIICLNL